MPLVLLAQASAATDPISVEWLFVKMVIVTILVVILALVTIRFIVPRLSGYRRTKESKIQVLDMQALDNRKAIYIVQIEDKRVAIGVTEQQVSKICDLD